MYFKTFMEYYDTINGKTTPLKEVKKKPKKAKKEKKDETVSD